jgi:hypothetical protein
MNKLNFSKAIIFDSGSLITLSMTCNLGLLKELKKVFKGKFLITESVKYEISIKPRRNKKYKLGALRLGKLIDEEVLEVIEDLGINHLQIKKGAKEYLNKSNQIFYRGNSPIHLIDIGEAECLALSKILDNKGIKNIIAIDEKTTRMLSEKSENLHSLLETKLHTKIKFEKNKYHKEDFGFRFIRSTELIFMAYKKGIVSPKNNEMLDALLYAAKAKGCAISEQEIKELEKLA